MEFSPPGPETQARIGDEEDFFAVDSVVAVLQLATVIALAERGQIAIGESNAFDLFAREMAGRPGDFEAALRGAVDEVRGSAEIACEIGVTAHGFKRGGRAAI